MDYIFFQFVLVLFRSNILKHLDSSIEARGSNTYIYIIYITTAFFALRAQKYSWYRKSRAGIYNRAVYMVYGIWDAYLPTYLSDHTASTRLFRVGTQQHLKKERFR